MRYTARLCHIWLFVSDSPPEAEADFSPVYARRILLASLVSVGMGFTVLFPILAPLGREIGLTEIQITTIISASGLIVFLSSPIWGRQSDVWGRKRVMLIGIFGVSLGTTIFTATLLTGVTGVLTGTTLFIALIVTRMLHATVMSASMPAANAYMADITDVESRTRGMGAAGAANNLGSILGPAVAGLAFISMLAPLWIMAAVAFLNALFVWRFLPEPPRQRTPVRPRRLRYSDRRILPFVIVGVLMFTGMGMVQQTIGFRIQDALSLNAADTAQSVGVAMMLSAVCSLLAQAVIVQRLTIAPFNLLRLAMPLLIVAFLMMATTTSQLSLTLAMGVLGLGMGLAGPGFMAGASLAVPPEEQGAVAGVAGSCGPLGFTIGPLTGGALYQVAPQLPYALTAGMYAVLFIAMFWLAGRVTQHTE